MNKDVNNKGVWLQHGSRVAHGHGDEDENNDQMLDNDDNNEDDEDDDEEDLEKLQAEIARMEEEAARITKETEELEKNKSKTSGDNSEKGEKDLDGKAQALKDAKSVYVGQVDYSTTPVELLGHFEPCGTVERVTIVCDKYTGRPKGLYLFSLVLKFVLERLANIISRSFSYFNLTPEIL